MILSCAPADKSFESSAALSTAETFADAFRTLYEQQKAREPKRSLAFLAKKIGIRSTGYLSDVMRGRRRLSHKLLPALSSALELNAGEARVLGLLAALDHARQPRQHRLLDTELSDARAQLEGMNHDSAYVDKIAARLLTTLTSEEYAGVMVALRRGGPRAGWRLCVFFSVRPSDPYDNESQAETGLVPFPCELPEEK